jgi:hypothetical protein
MQVRPDALVVAQPVAGVAAAAYERRARDDHRSLTGHGPHRSGHTHMLVASTSFESPANALPA